MQTRRLLVAPVVVFVAVVVGAACATPELVVKSLTPPASFASSPSPPAPDYTSDAAWLALPSTNDAADVALAVSPAIDQQRAPVEVFYLHSTSSLAPQWNSADVDDVRIASIRGGTLIQASAFNDVGAIWAPGYRQAAGVAFTSPSADGDAAIALAFDDVRAAFTEFRRRTPGRPFVVAAHSQGSVLGARLVREVIAPTNERALLVAAYLIGAPLRAGDDVGGLPACATSTSTGCIIAFNARLVGHTPQPVDFGADVPEKDRLCVNPTTGSVTSTTASTLEHGGAVFFDSAHPRVVPRFLSSTCRDGRLVVSELQPLPRRGPMDAILLAMMGGTNLHPIEYQLFFMDLRRDLRRRVDAFSAVAR